MFAVITCNKTHCSLMSKLKHFIRAPVAIPIQTKLYNSSYYVISIKHKCSAKQLAFACEEFPGKLLISSEIVLPQNSMYTKPDTSVFDRRILINTAKSILKNSSVPLYMQSIGIIDVDGCCNETVRELVFTCPSVKVFTLNAINYSDFCFEMMEEHGAVISIVNTPQALSDMSIIISPMPFVWEDKLSIKPPILSVQNVQLNGAVQLIHSFFPLLPTTFISQIPLGVSPHEFAAAAYTHCNIPFLQDCIAESGICKQNLPSVNQITNYINNEFYSQSRKK
ncbi:MAG: hypothetical protein RRZ73_01155 [Oscillospiraceae bacterium]